MTTAESRGVRFASALRIGALLFAGVLAAGAAAVLPAPPAHAVGGVTITPAPDPEGPTVVVLQGSGFQYQPNAPGGVYVFFGVVSDAASNAWAPSQGGATGVTYSYASTDGAIRLVAFEGGSSASEANAVIDANGEWEVEFTIPGSRFTSSSGNPHDGAAQEGDEIDCLTYTCGIITIGAHGTVNANNESFTPVTFAVPESPGPTAPPTGPAEEGAATEAADPAAPGASSGPEAGVIIALAAGAAVVLAAAIGIPMAVRRSRAAHAADGPADSDDASADRPAE